MSDRREKALRIIKSIETCVKNMQTLSDELAKLSKHPDEFVSVSGLQNDIHKARQAFETQINNEEVNVD